MKLSILLLSLLLLTGCARQPADSSEPTTVPAETQTTLPLETTAPETLPPDPIQELLDSLSTEERVGQLFLARCSKSTALEDIGAFHLGGFVLFGGDFDGQTKQSMAETIARYQDAARIPLLISVDEEGGTVNRISRLPEFREAPFASPRDLYQGGGIDWVLTEAEQKCQLLQSLGIQVNLGPVCDITTDRSAFMYRRSLGLDPVTTGDVIGATVRVMNAYHIGSVLKHFPGYGNNTDTHTAMALDNRSLEELERHDLIPFSMGIQAGAGAIMVSHTIVTAMDAGMPASLSPAVHRYIRDQMGFDGVILTDDLVMQAITDSYGPGEAAVLAVLAGNDLLCSSEFQVQYEAVLAAVNDSRIDPATLDAAVYRVLRWKHQLNLL